MFVSRVLLGPPKAPRNVFFPWFNFLMFKSGAYLAPNRIAFRVPVHLTKPEIRTYLREIYDVKVIKVNTYIKLPKIRRNAYGDYFKNGPQYKKAIVTCEETIPDDVKMIYNSRYPVEQPAITKHAPSGIRTIRSGVNRKNDWSPRHHYAWAEPLPTLLRGDDFLGPRTSSKVLPDHTKPFQHYTDANVIPEGTPHQEFPRIDLAVLRADKIRKRDPDPERKLITLPRTSPAGEE